MDELDFDELFHGKTIADKAKLFKAELEEINIRYKDFFEKRKSPFPEEECDNIFNHCITYTSQGSVSFNFTDEELPEHIKTDCINAFKKVYPTQ